MNMRMLYIFLTVLCAASASGFKSVRMPFRILRAQKQATKARRVQKRDLSRAFPGFPNRIKNYHKREEQKRRQR